MLTLLFSKKPKYTKTSLNIAAKHAFKRASHTYCINDIVFYPKTPTPPAAVSVEILHIFIDRLDIIWHRIIDFFRYYYQDRHSYILYRFKIVTKYKGPKKLTNYTTKCPINHLYTYKYFK